MAVLTALPSVATGQDGSGWQAESPSETAPKAQATLKAPSPKATGASDRGSSEDKQPGANENDGAALARRKAEALQRKAEALDAQVRAAKSENASIRQQAADARAAADKAAKDSDEAQSRLDKTKSDLDSAEDKISSKESTIDNLWLIVAGVVALLVMISLVAFLVLRARQKRLEAESARARAAAAEADVLRSIPKRIEPYADCLLEGSKRNLSLPGAMLPEEAGGVTIGRHPKYASAVLDSEDISRLHARIFVRDRRLYIEDMGSTYGTFVDGDRLDEGEQVRISPGTAIRLASLDFVLRKVG